MKLSAIYKAVRALSYFAYCGIREGLEPIRVARVGYALLSSGCSAQVSFFRNEISKYLLKHQLKDGGWTDIEETVWCLGYLSTFKERFGRELARGYKYIERAKLPCGAWGKSHRDRPRIPLTALTAILTPHLVNNTVLTWVEQQWERDLCSSTALTYKGAFYLLMSGSQRGSYNANLAERTVDYLQREQQADGGFGPWKGHPLGSDPWTSGTVLWGLSKYGKGANKELIRRTIKWLETDQLIDGLWPYHYLDDGTAMALIGLSSALVVQRN